MPKSKYPQSLDTSVELPAVRDSVLSDTINSLRSAVIQIERTLGVNPQGTVGNTVASRLNRVIDGSGNILPDAFTQAGLLSGPINDQDVSENASISERKINLNFPTQLLQDEISMLQADIESFSAQIEELSVKISTHISSSALNRHPATAISVSLTESTASDEGAVNIEQRNVQGAIEDIYNKHINYSGLNISEINNSHLASQIYFNNENIIDLISADNIQDAIEQASSSALSEKNIHQDMQHSNGLLRLGKLSSVEDSNLSEVLASNVSATFSASSGGSTGTFIIILVDNVDISNFDLRPFDYVKIINPSDVDELFVGTYEIKTFTLSGSTLVSIECYGYVGSSSLSGTTIIIGKNIERETSKHSLLLTATEEATLTSSRFLRLSNPDANRLFSVNINPFAITSINRYIILNVDDDSYILDAYEPSLSRQSIDSIITRLNEQLTEAHANAMTYRIDYEGGGSELVFVHSIPDDENESHVLSVSRHTDDGILALGFSHIEDITTKTVFGNKYFLNGEEYSGLKSKLDSKELVFFSGSNQIGIGNSATNFIEAGIRIGDTVIISGANNSSDNGTYIIDQMSSSYIRVSSGQLPSGFADVSVLDQTRIRVYSNSVSVEDITFDRVAGSFGSTVLDIFMDKNREINFSKLLEYSNVLSGTTSLVEIVDVEGSDLYDEYLTLNFEENIDDSNAFFVNIDGSDSINIVGENKYVWITSYSKNIRLKIYIPDSASIASKIAADGTGFSIGVYMLETVNTESNMHLGRIAYNNFNGRFSGGFGAPRCLSKLQIGNVSSKDISNIAKKELIEGPISHLRYNGIIYGFEVDNITIDSNNFYNFRINRGLCYVNGKRIEKEAVSNIITDINSSSIDKMYIIIDENGFVQVSSAVPSCITPFGESEFALIGSIEYDGVNLEYIDLRLFINHLDLKILNSITVSPQKGLAHFNTIVAGLKYAKRFSQMFPDAGIPILHLKSGTHKIELEYNYNETSGAWSVSSSGTLETYYNKQIESGFLIDFPITIEGEGQSTIVELVNNSNWTDVSHVLTMPIIILGNGFAAATRGHNNVGDNDFVTIRDLTLKNSRISIIDFNTSSGGSDIRTGININNVIFDYQQFAGNFIDGSWGPRAIELLEISDIFTPKGNISISGCTFIRCGIYTDSISRTKNLSITENISIDEGDTTNLLFNDLYSFATASSGSNISIYGNRYVTNTNPNNGTGPEIVSGGSLMWGERFDRDVRVGNNVYIEVDGYVGNKHMYYQTRDVSRFYWIDQLVNMSSSNQAFQESTTRYTYGISTYTAGGETSTFPYITQSSSSAMRLKFPVIRNAKLKSITIGYNNLGPGNTCNIDLYSVNSGGGSTTFGTSPVVLVESDSFTGPMTVSSVNIASRTIDYSADNITLSSQGGYLLEIDDTVSNSIRIYWISIKIEVNNIEEILDVEIP